MTLLVPSGLSTGPEDSFVSKLMARTLPSPFQLQECDATVPCSWPNSIVVLAMLPTNQPVWLSRTNDRAGCQLLLMTSSDSIKRHKPASPGLQRARHSWHCHFAPCLLLSSGVYHQSGLHVTKCSSNPPLPPPSGGHTG